MDPPSSCEDEEGERLGNIEEEEEKEEEEGGSSVLVPSITKSNSVFLLHGDM